jgi:hypothetical protein
VSPPCFANALADGWTPDSENAGAEAREILQCLSWVGRTSAQKLVKHLKADEERYWGSIHMMAVYIQDHSGVYIPNIGCTSRLLSRDEKQFPRSK